MDILHAGAHNLWARKQPAAQHTKAKQLWLGCRMCSFVSAAVLGRQKTAPLKVPTKMPSPILFRKSPMGRAATAPTDCTPCLPGGQPGGCRADGACAGAAAGSARPHIACTLRLKVVPEVSAAAASSSLHVMPSDSGYRCSPDKLLTAGCAFGHEPCKERVCSWEPCRTARALLCKVEGLA